MNRPVFYLCFSNASESDDGDDSARKKARKYKRPRVKWNSVVLISKGAEAEMDDDERKAQILQGARAFMEAGKIYKLPGHKSCASDLGLWKQAADLLKLWCISALLLVVSDVRPK